MPCNAHTPIQRSVPAFLNKLYSMVNDPTTNELICWSEDGTSFFVNNQEDFARKVLPRFFKHNKFSSFVRQLNMYGFHKVPHLQQGLFQTENELERWEFSNPHFQLNQPDLLLLVTRKKGTNSEEKELSNIELNHILDEIQSIKKHQTNISGQLQAIQHDNQALWQETISARERHLRHQETIDKILRFLASVFSSEKRSAIPRKRRYLLGSVDEQEEPRIKMRKTEAPLFDLDDYVNGKDSSSPISLGSTGKENTADLADAIALNNQSKGDHSTPSSNDFSTVPNLHDFSTIQNLMTLAQSSPDITDQLTSAAFLPEPTPPSSLSKLSNNIASISEDIDNLDLSLQALAEHLGFDPSKLTQNKEEQEILDMDEFLHTFGKLEQKNALLSL
ncbi:hypothetical protein BDB01DRAFT_721902 [Pilobolus umbonatus]|nr:hypothetical protein BDB01DRAFT_721902 [Pilobolus umbonatus]